MQIVSEPAQCQCQAGDSLLISPRNISISMNLDVGVSQALLHKYFKADNGKRYWSLGKRHLSDKGIILYVVSARAGTLGINFSATCRIYLPCTALIIDDRGRLPTRKFLEDAILLILFEWSTCIYKMMKKISPKRHSSNSLTAWTLSAIIAVRLSDIQTT